MTSDRAAAYGRVMRMIDELAGTKLQPPEVERIRAAADTLLFVGHADDSSAHEALGDVEALAYSLTESERYEESRARALIEAVTACGPVELV